jgi:hypothetical protein
MKLFVHVTGENPEKELLQLKKYIENAQIEDLETIELTRVAAKKGEMGSGIVGSLTAVLIGAANPFSRLVEAFSKYASSYRTEIIIRNEYGDELVLNTKKLDREGINYLVDKFLDKSKASKTVKQSKTSNNIKKAVK